MTPPFTVRTPGPYEHHFRKLLKRYPDLAGLQERAVEILEQDPYNRGRQYDIKKLMDVPPGEGQYRLRLGRWRFRFDISGRAVDLLTCELRSERTYRP